MKQHTGTQFLLFLCCVFVVSFTMKTGRMTEPHPACEEVQGLLDSVKGDVEAKLGIPFDTFKATLAATQLVHGIYYFVKVDVGDGQFIHVKIYKTFSGDVKLHSIQDKKTENDTLEYF